MTEQIVGISGLKMLIEKRERDIERRKEDLAYFIEEANKYNRKGFYSLAAQYGEKITMTGYELGVLMDDLEAFKKYVEILDTQEAT